MGFRLTVHIDKAPAIKDAKTETIKGIKNTISVRNIPSRNQVEGFGVGMIIYAIGVGHYFNEGISVKTMISLVLALMLICIQVFWK